MPEGYKTPIETRCATSAAAPWWAAVLRTRQHSSGLQMGHDPIEILVHVSARVQPRMARPWDDRHSYEILGPWHCDAGTGLIIHREVLRNVAYDSTVQGACIVD